MSLEALVKNELAGWSSFHGNERLLEVSDGDHQLTCPVVALDRLACAFTRLSVRSQAASPKNMAELQEVAKRLSGRLTYLLEPISPIEVDAHGCTVQMRSTPPQKDDDGLSYYELLVDRDGQLSLCRYRRAAAATRTVIPCEVTREVFARLVQDFAAAA